MSARDPEPPPYRGPLQGLGELAELLGGDTPGSRRFLRGLALGALVGAAIAGSRIWARRNHREPGDSHGERPDEERT
ncbi:MAG TPA: hypothetical protein VFK54_12415 [Candidatus Limnocylindrales bacterium]|nr:hypothetical protein [Candidatus Limnocylindrales bacterium]